MNKGVIRVALIAAGLMVSVSPFAAQQPPANRPAAVEGREGAKPLADMSAEQRKAWREANESVRDEQRVLNEKLNKARRELNAAIYAEKLDEAAVRERALEVGKLQAELSVLRARVIAKARPALTAEQIERMRGIPPVGDAGGARTRDDAQHAPAADGDTRKRRESQGAGLPPRQP